MALERDLETLVDGPFRLPANAASTAELLHVSFLDGLHEADLERLKGKFLRAVHAREMADDLLPGTVRYARRLATDEDELIYEEVHLLFNLFEQVLALRWLGFEIDDDAHPGYLADVKQRLKDQKSAAKIVAEDKATVHDESYWWMTYVAGL